MKRFRKVGKVLFRLLAGILLVLVILAALIQIPAIQQRLTGSIENYLQEKLQTEVSISSIRLKIPESLVLRGLHIADRQKDTLLHLQELALNFKLNKLLNKSIQFDKITLVGGAAELKFAEEGSNLDFVTQAFSSDKKDTPQKADSKAWLMTFDDAQLQLEDVNFQYTDSRSKLALNSHVGKLKCGIKQLDYQKANFRLKQFDLRDADLELKIGTASKPIATNKQIQIFNILSEEIELRNVDFHLTSEDLELHTKIGQLENDSAAFTIGKDVIVELASAKIANTHFQYDKKTAESIKKGFDYNHIDLKEINAKLADFKYNNLDIVADVSALSAKDSNGFLLKNCDSKFHYTKDQIQFNNLNLLTDKSEVTSSSTGITFPFEIDTRINLKTQDLSDIRYFYPGIDQLVPINYKSKTPISLIADVQGNSDDLRIKTLNFSGLGSLVNVSGSIKNISQSAQLSADLTIDQIKTRGSMLSALIPPGTFPDSLTLPKDIFLSGQIKGKLADFKTDITLRFHQADDSSLSQLIGNANIRNITDFKNAQFDINIDTLITNPEEIRAYIPKAKLPIGLTLPERLLLSGKINGASSKFYSDIKLNTFRNQKSNLLTAKGSLANLFNSENPTLDITVEGAKISAEEIAAYLPDSLLSPDFRLPDIDHLTGTFKGEFEDFQTDFQLESTIGAISAIGSLNNDQYNLDLETNQFHLAALFPNQQLDSISGFPIPKLNVALEAIGQGFQLTKNAYSNFKVNVKSHNLKTKEGLTLEGVLKEQILKVELVAEEREIEAQGFANINFASEAQEWDIDLLLEQLDLEPFITSKDTFQIAGKIQGNGKGFDENDLFGQALLSELQIQFSDQLEKIDSLNISALLKNGDKKIELGGDFTTGTLVGNFQFQPTLNAIRQQIYNFWKNDHPTDFVGTSNDSFALILNLHRPEILTMGFIPALKELSPAVIDAQFNNESSTINLAAEVEHLVWNSIALDTMNILANGHNAELDYHISFSDGQLGSQMNLDNCVSTGILSNDALKNSTQLFDDQGTKRYDVQTLSRFIPNKDLELFLNTSQLLNYKTWNVPESNHFVWSDNELAVENWVLSHEDQSIKINDTGKQKLQVVFDQFNLKTLSDFINLDRELVTGILNGVIDINGEKQKPILTADLAVDNLTALHAKFGNLKLKTTNAIKNELQADISLSGEGHDLNISGTYNTIADSSPLGLKMNVNRLNLNAIQSLLLPAYLDNLTGTAVGNISISGTFEKPKMNGALTLNETAFDLEQYKSRFTLGQETVNFTNNKIEVKDLSFQDLSGNHGKGSVIIQTDNFRNFTIDATAGVQDFLVLNTTRKDNENYWGKLRVDALATIQGNLIAPSIEVTAQPTKNSAITYVYGIVSTQLESNEGIVEFVLSEQEQLKAAKDQAAKKLFKIADELGIKIVLKAAIDDNLNVKIITNPISGDYFEGKASGDLVYTQLPDGTLELNGAIEIKEGTYLFTYQQYVKRTFEVKEGGRLNWTGDPYSPDMNINVVYKSKTSPYPLLSGLNDSDDNETVSNVPKQTFYVNLNVSGKPTETILTTDIEYPRIAGNSNDSDINTAIDRINQDPGEQNTQAFSMILFNGFMASEANDINFQVSDVIDVQGKINNVITQQLNTLADRYIKFVELDFGLESASNSENITQNDYRISIKKRFLNDRLTVSLDGKTSSFEDNDNNSTQTYLDDVTIEYALTPDGRFKIKIYNERDYDDFIGGTAVKYGGSLVFSKDFDKISFKRKDKATKPKK